ncbi:helix-turn-helix transcriptional regulator [Nocardia sp. NPDC050713]|uniref:helix-turn-helix domain-containing protein n=2 Tax=Nocardia TaxID=1817 RepID=UPI003410EE40
MYRGGSHGGGGLIPMGERKSWADLRSELMDRPGAGAAYEAARIRFELGAAVRARREELGMTQAELAERAGLKQPAVARFEAGGTMPTIPMLERYAEALGLRLEVRLREAG